MALASHARLRAFTGIAAGVLGVAFAAGTAFGQISIPNIVDIAGQPSSGPIPEQAHNRLHGGIFDNNLRSFLTADYGPRFDPATYGYVVEEYFISGAAADAPYTTRILIARPADPANFSGMALLETQHPAGAFQTYNHTRIGGMQAGHMYVGVTNTAAGFNAPNGLRGLNEPRYAVMSIASNNQANPIIAQVAALIKSANPAGADFNADWVVMTGASATAGTANNFMIQPNGNTASGHALNGAPPVDAMYIWDNVGYATNNNDGNNIRGNHVDGPLRNIPTIVLATQHEFDANFTGANQANLVPDRDPGADGELYRLYQVPGSPHIGTRLGSATDPTVCTMQPVSNFLDQGLMYMPIRHMYAYLSGGEAPPQAPRVDFPNADSGFAVDQYGNATGGIRSPQMDVPLYTYGTPNSGPGQCGLMGYMVPLTDEQLAERYPGGRADYVAQFAKALVEAIAAGYYPPEYLWDALDELDAFGRSTTPYWYFVEQ